MKNILNLIQELDRNSIAQTVALVYEKIFGFFFFILIVLSFFIAAGLYEYGSGKHYDGLLDLQWNNAFKNTVVYLVLLVLINLIFTFIFGVLATFISINSYLRQLVNMSKNQKEN